MNHMEFAALESAALTPNAIEVALAKIETIIGHDIDGSQDVDGYSLDAAYDLLKCGHTPHQVVDIFRQKPRCATIDTICALVSKSKRA